MVIKPTLAKSLALFFLIGAGITTIHAGTPVTMDLVTVGNPGNAADTTGYGSVGHTYEIGKYDVTVGQYTSFLNAVGATDTYNLYNQAMATNLNIAGISRSGSSGSYSYSVIGSANHPITYVSWFDAARFANWMANGQPTGGQTMLTTENGAYTLNGANSGVSFTLNGINPNTSAAPTFWIPSENEWYKAAYYDPSLNSGSGGYWLYPTRSNTAPGNTIGSGANQANYNNGVYSVTQSSRYSSTQNYLTDVGAFSASGSAYGTYDQGGDVWQWDDAVIGSSRGLRGGSLNHAADSLQSSNRSSVAATLEDGGLGFRVASVATVVPEPSTYALFGLGAIGMLMVLRRKKTS